MLAEEDRRAGRGSRTFWLWKTIVLSVEGKCSGRGSRTFWLLKTIVLAGEGKCSGSVGASALVEEDRCFLPWKTSVLAEEDERAGCGRSMSFMRT